MISEPTKLSKTDLSEITYHEDNVIPNDIIKTRKSKKTAKSKEPTVDIFDEEATIPRQHSSSHDRMVEEVTDRMVISLNTESPLYQPMCENPDCRSISTVGGLCVDCHQATIMHRRTPSRR